MRRHAPPILALLGIALPAVLNAQRPEYPASARDSVVENLFGHRVADPYRWMEALDSPETKRWIDAQNAVTFAYLANLPPRETIRERVTALWNYPRIQVPVREAGQLFFRQNSGLQKQSVLYRQVALTSEPRELLNPNTLSPDGSIAVAGWSISPDGRYLAYTTAEGGSDLQDIHLRDLSSGRDLEEVVPRVKYSSISWTRDSKGFCYARFKSSRESANLQDANEFHQVWYHPIGALTDRLVFDRPSDPNDGVGGAVSDDGRWLFLSAGSGSGRCPRRGCDLYTPGRGRSVPLPLHHLAGGEGTDRRRPARRQYPEPLARCDTGGSRGDQ